MKGQRRRQSSRSPAAFVTDPTIRVGMCTPCDKVIFLSRKVARYAAERAVGGVRPRAYRCPANTDHWHLGHIPGAVRQGVIDREQWARHKGWPTARSDAMPDVVALEVRPDAPTPGGG